MQPIPVLVIAGPTATGKSRLALQLAKRLSGEIVNADSMQIYDTLMVGTARPTPEEMGDIPHHLFGFCPITTPYNVGQYVQTASKAIQGVAARGKCPILCGGTGLYITSLLENRTFLEQPTTDPLLRQQLRAQLSAQGQAALYAKLVEIDPQAAKQIHPGNHQRLLRALELYETTGQTITMQNEASHRQASPFLPVRFALDYQNRSLLWQRIEKRIDQMLENGLLQEAALLKEIAPNSTAAQAIGYKELFDYLDQKESLPEAKERLVIATRRYAKRQRTWFKREPYTWLYPDAHPTLAAFEQAALAEVEGAWHAAVLQAKTI